MNSKVIRNTHNIILMNEIYELMKLLIHYINLLLVNLNPSIIYKQNKSIVYVPILEVISYAIKSSRFYKLNLFFEFCIKLLITKIEFENPCGNIPP